MDEKDKKIRWLVYHQIQLSTASNVGKTDFDYSTHDPLFVEMMKIHFPLYLREYLLKNPFPQLDICAVGSGIRPEFLPLINEMKRVYPKLEVNTFCVDHVFWQNEARVLFLSTVARELNLPLVSPNISPSVDKEGWAQYQLDFLTVYLTKLFDQSFSLPQTAQNVAVTLFHSLNYLNANDVIQFLEDPRVKIVCVANGKDRGFRELFNGDRFTDFFDTTIAFKQLGFNLDVYENDKNRDKNFTAIYSR